MSMIRFPAHAAGAKSDRGRSVADRRASRPSSSRWVATSGPAYGVMNLLMAARCWPCSAGAAVPRRGAGDRVARAGHVRAGPFFTGHLIQRFGTLRVMVAGVLLNSGLRRHRADGARAGTLPGGLAAAGHRLELPLHRRDHAADHHLPAPRKAHARAGAMDLCVFSTTAVTFVRLGRAGDDPGWFLLNLGSLVPLSMVALALAWLARRSRDAWCGRPGRSAARRVALTRPAARAPPASASSATSRRRA